MARFDPMTFPDRLVLEANARRIRTEELGKLIAAMGGWLESRRHELTSRLRKFASAHCTPAHRHSAR